MRKKQTIREKYPENNGSWTFEERSVQMRNGDELRESKVQLENEVKKLLLKFEQENGADLVRSIDLTRWNGSNNAFGPISKVSIALLIQ